MERTLLLVDDEENILSALIRLFRRDNYKILRANGGKAALELLAEHKVGVIVSDQRMPEMTGVELLCQVRDLYPNTVRIVLSGYTELNSITDAINKGAVYKFLTKPWDDELLRNNIREAFEYFELKSENEKLACLLKEANEELLRINKALEMKVEEKVKETQFNSQALQSSQEILDILPTAVIGIDTEGIVTLVNHAAKELLFPGKRILIGHEQISEIDGALNDIYKNALSTKDDVVPEYQLSINNAKYSVRSSNLIGRGFVFTFNRI